MIVTKVQRSSVVIYCSRLLTCLSICIYYLMLPSARNAIYHTTLCQIQHPEQDKFALRLSAT